MACFTDFELTYNASNFVLRPWVWLSLVATKSGRPPSLFNQLHRNVYFTNIKWIRSYFSLSSLLSLHLARIRLPSQPRLCYKRGTELGANVCCQWWRLVRSDLDRGVPAHYRCELTQTLRSCCCFLYMCILGLMHRSNAPPRVEHPCAVPVPKLSKRTCCRYLFEASHTKTAHVREHLTCLDQWCDWMRYFLVLYSY